MLTFALTREQRITRRSMAIGSAVSLLAALLCVGFAVRGLASADYPMMAACALIAAGFAVLVQGATIAARWGGATHVVGRERIDVVSMFSEIVGGLACIALGTPIVANHIAAVRPLAIATVILGLTVLLAARTQADVVELAPTLTSRWQARRERVGSTAMVISGLVALAAGILAWVRGPLLPIVMAMLLVAAAMAVAGGSLLVRFARKID